MRNTVVVPVECRASTEGARLRATVIQEGRASRGIRAEIFAPGALAWPKDGIAIRTIHLGTEETRAVPERLPDGRIVIDAPATPAVFKAVQEGARYASIEFHSVAETRTDAGIRELTCALLVGAALVPNPEYEQTAAEVRAKTRRVWL